MKRIAIIGGGLSGLTAAYHLQKKSVGRYEITLFESSPRLGGVIETEIRDGMIFEAGPDCFLAKKPAGRDLCEQIGLGGEVIGTREGFRRSFIYLQKKMHAIPQGFYLMAPGKLSALAALSVLSFRGKVRAALEFLIPPRKIPDHPNPKHNLFVILRGAKDLVFRFFVASAPQNDKEDSDESIQSFITRRLGRELFERIGQPMVGGIYGGDPSKLSIQATLPQFPEMEREDGGIIRALRKKNKKGSDPFADASGPRYSLFLSMAQGMEQMVRGLVSKLDSVKIYTACRIENLQNGVRPWGQTPGSDPIWSLIAQGGRKFEADAILLAVPAYAAAGMIRNSSEILSGELQSIPYGSMATVNLLYRKSDIEKNICGAGFVIPKIENTFINACSVSSQKFEGRVSEDYVLLRAFVGGELYPESYLVDDQTMREKVHEELSKILEIYSQPVSSMIRRYERAMPQYLVGHRQKIARIREQLKSFPGIFLTGNAYEGIGIPDVIEQAQKQSDAIMEFLK